MRHASDSPRRYADCHGPSLRDLLASILAECGRSRRERGLPDVTTTLDVPDEHRPATATATLRRLLEPLLRRALEAADHPDAESDAPTVREILVTSVDEGGRLEIEVADSGPALSPAVRAWLAGDGDDMPEGAGLSLASVRAAVARIGGTVRGLNCPEGGVAITISLPHRRAERLAA